MEARLLMEKKNHDYSKLGAFDNLKLCEAAGVCSPTTGVLVRMCDKIGRLASVLEKGTAVKDESVRDTVIDLINYAVILDAIGSEYP